MKFDLLHRGISVLTVLIGFMVLYLSGEFPALLMAAASLTVLIGSTARRAFDRRWASIAANVVMVGAGLAGGYQAFVTGNFLYYTIVYSVFLGAVKAMMLRRSGDFMQLYVLSFLHVVAGAVVNPGLSFGVAMFPYVIALTLSLMLTNLRRGIEEDLGSDQKGDDHTDRMTANLSRKDLIRPGFLSVTVAVTIGVFLVSLVFFFLFPRLGLGFFATQSRLGISMTGFSDEVTLGDFGNVIEDPEVVMRVRMKGRPALTPLRMRGQSLDEYDGRTWRKTTRRLRALNMDGRGRYRADDNTLRLDELDPLVQEVYLEPMTGTPRVLFGMPNAVGFERPASSLEALRPDKWRFYRDDAFDVSITGPPRSAIVYTVHSVPDRTDPDKLRGAGSDYSAWMRSRYTQLPHMDSRVGEMARGMVDNAAAAYDAAVTVESRLSGEFEYALDTSHGEKDPLVDFLLSNRRGHCEYFASAMVVLLRSLGIPSRIVNGFHGGEANQYGDYVYLRKADAHSWVEVWFPGSGWVTFDPTPAVALQMRVDRSWWRKVTDAVDTVKLWWYQWVIEYDLERQVRFIVGLFRLLDDNDKGAFGDAGLRWKDFKELKSRLIDQPWGHWFAWLGGALALAVLFAWFWRRRRSAHGAELCRPGDPAVDAYRRMTKLLARKRLVRNESETQLEFLDRVSVVLPEALVSAGTVTSAYVNAAFSSSGPASDEYEMADCLTDLRRVT